MIAGLRFQLTQALLSLLSAFVVNLVGDVTSGWFGFHSLSWSGVTSAAVGLILYLVNSGRFLSFK